MPTFDFDDLTELSESDPRQGDFDTLQWHHTVTTSYAGARSLMAAGGRTVSANGLMDSDGRLGRVVDLSRRAYTSASSFDHRSFTIECVNTSGDPDYGLSDVTHKRMGKALAEMVREGRSRVIYGPGGLLQHKDVPGSYATACAGPSADSVRVLAYADAYLNPPKPKRGHTMAVLKPTTGGVWPGRPLANRIITDWRYKELVTDAKRVAFLDYAPPATGELVVVDQVNWEEAMKLPDFPKVSAGGGYDDSALMKRLGALEDAIAGVPAAVIVEQKKPGN